MVGVDTLDDVDTDDDVEMELDVDTPKGKIRSFRVTVFGDWKVIG